MNRYLFLLIGASDHYDVWERATDEQRQSVLDRHRGFSLAVRARGTMVAGEALERPSRGFWIGLDSEGRMVVDGPYAEATEQVAGFYLADLPDRATAMELAALLPPSQRVEVRDCPDVGVTPR